MTTYPVLTVTTFLPLVGAAVIPVCRERPARWIGLATTLARWLFKSALFRL